MTKQKRLLFLSDNDGTLFNTFEQSPTGYGVHEAYGQALLDIFGHEALAIFKKNGLKNRAPGQVIELVLAQGHMGKMVENAKIFFNKAQVCKLDNLVPEGKGHKLIWDDDNLHPLFTELLVRVKLSYLMKNIGSKNSDGTLWPRIYPGVREFIDTLKWHGDFGIISSGHDLFIQKSFEIYGIECPEIMVTDDDIRSLSFKNKSLISKPSPYLIHLALRQWKYGDMPPSDGIVYTGDDMQKDGQMATNTSVPFIYFDPQTSEHHWFDLRNLLIKGRFPF